MTTLPILKPPAIEEIEASSIYKMEREIRSDIKKIDGVLQKSDFNEMESLHRYLDAKYQHVIAEWGKGMYGYNLEHGFLYDILDPDSIINNLYTMKPKLEAFIYKWNAQSSSSSLKKSQNINVNNIVNISISFNETRKQIEEMASLTAEQINEALDRINEIERIIKTNDSKKSKWEKLKPIFVWLADKSYDLAKTILPLLLKVTE